MLAGADPLLPQPGPPDHRAGDALGDEHSVAAGQVLAAWTRTGHDQVLYKGEKQELSKSSKGSTDSLLQANVTEFLDTEGLPRELGGEDDWQYSWQVFSCDGVDTDFCQRSSSQLGPRYFPMMVLTKSLPKKYFPTTR